MTKATRPGAGKGGAARARGGGAADARQFGRGREAPAQALRDGAGEVVRGQAPGAPSGGAHGGGTFLEKNLQCLSLSWPFRLRLHNSLDSAIDAHCLLAFMAFAMSLIAPDLHICAPS